MGDDFSEELDPSSEAAKQAEEDAKYLNAFHPTRTAEMIGLLEEAKERLTALVAEGYDNQHDVKWLARLAAFEESKT
jgi:primosomal protein N''